MKLEQAQRRWSGRVIVAASGPSLTQEVAHLCQSETIVAVNDAYRLLPFPWAEVLFSCDSEWWDAHSGVPGFAGERWTSHSLRPLNDKRRLAERYDMHVIEGREEDGFSLDPSVIHYGRNSGFQAVNLALLMGGNPIILVGFDMRRVDGREHFFGTHPPGMRPTGPFSVWIDHFRRAAETLPPEIRILNATPGSALDCFPMVDLTDVIGEMAA